MLGFITMKGPAFFLLYLASFVVALLLGYLIRYWKLQGTADVAAVLDRLTPTEVATLRDGPRGALLTALVGLYRQRRLVVDEDDWLEGRGGRRESDEALTAAIADAMGDGEPRTVTEISGMVESTINAHTAALPEGLVLGREDMLRIRIAAAVPGALVMLMGLAKFFRGISMGKPVGFLFIALMVSAVLLVFLYRFMSRITHQGTVALAVLRNRYAALQTTALANSDMLEDDDAILAYALLGRDVLSGRLTALKPPFDAFDSTDSRVAMRRREAFDGFYVFDCATPIVVASSGGSDAAFHSCGSSCSSCGGCGGGCGGCGGCG